MKHYKPGERFNKFQEKKKKYQAKHKTYSEADMGSMKGYDPNLGLGKAGMRRLSAPKMSAAKMPAKPVMFGGKALSGQNSNSTKMMMKRKHSKHKKNWIAKAISKPGALHRELGVKAGNKIPAKTLAKAAKKGGVEGKRARLAETLKSFHHKKRKMTLAEDTAYDKKHGIKEHSAEDRVIDKLHGVKDKKHRKHQKGMGKKCKMCGK